MIWRNLIVIMVILVACVCGGKKPKKNRHDRNNDATATNEKDPIRQIMQSFQTGDLNQFNHAVHALQTSMLMNKKSKQQQQETNLQRQQDGDNPKLRQQQQQGVTAYLPSSCPCKKNKRKRYGSGGQLSTSRKCVPKMRKRKNFSDQSSHHVEKPQKKGYEQQHSRSFEQIHKPLYDQTLRPHTYNEEVKPMQHNKNYDVGPPSIYPAESSNFYQQPKNSYKQHSSIESTNSEADGCGENESSSSSSSSSSCSCENNEAITCGQCRIKSLFRFCAACHGLVVPQIAQLKTIPNGCSAFRAYRPPTTQYYFVNPNGTVVITNSTVPIVIECGIDNEWYQYYGVAASTAIVISQLYCVPITTLTTTTTATTSICNQCLRSTIDPRLDALTNFTTAIVGGCLQATTACVGQTNPATPNLKYHIVYADGSVEDNTIIAATAGPTLLCNSNGNWVDTSNSKVVSQFFCYETVTASGCVACTSHTSTTIFSDINVPVYNVSSASPNQCCNQQAFVASNTTGPLSKLVASATPSNAGLIGTANCSNTNSSQLCVCGYYIAQTTTQLCWFGNNSNVYILEYCNSTTSVCSTYVIPFVGSNSLVEVSGAGNTIAMPSFTSPIDVDSIWSVAYPIITQITCTATKAQCSASNTG